MKTVLTIDKEGETFESLRLILIELSKEVGEDSLVFLNEKALKITEINELIKEDHPDIILIGHVLRGIFSECVDCKLKYGDDVKFTNCPSCHLDGLQALRLLKPLPREIKIISISSFAVCSKKLVSEYRQIGVNHFSGRDYRNMASCIFGTCDCGKYNS